MSIGQSVGRSVSHTRVEFRRNGLNLNKTTPIKKQLRDKYAGRPPERSQTRLLDNRYVFTLQGVSATLRKLF